MGKRGPRPTTEAERWLRGSRTTTKPAPANGRRTRKKATQARYRTPSAPDYLDEHGRRCWSIMHKELAARGLLEAVDVFSLEQCAFAFQTWRAAAEELTSTGATVPGDRWKEARKKSPAWQIAREAFEQFTKLSDRFGLSPQSRERLNLDDDDEDDVATAWTAGW